MSTFRVERSNAYWLVSYYHIFDSRISLKAKGLLSIMLSQFKGEGCTISGLAAITGETIDIIKSGIKELVETGYIDHRQLKDEKGHFGNAEYTLHERPKGEEDVDLGRVEKGTWKKYYALVSSKTMLNKNLSLKAKGLYLIMLSLQNEGNFAISGLTTFCKDGIKAVRTGIKDLKKMGFLEQVDTYEDQEKIFGEKYLFFAEPETDEEL